MGKLTYFVADRAFCVFSPHILLLHQKLLLLLLHEEGLVSGVHLKRYNIEKFCKNFVDIFITCLCCCCINLAFGGPS